MNLIVERTYCHYCEPFIEMAILELNPKREIGDLTIFENINSESIFTGEMETVWNGKKNFATPVSQFDKFGIIKKFGRIYYGIKGMFHIEGFDSKFTMKIFLKNLREKLLGGY